MKRVDADAAFPRFATTATATHTHSTNAHANEDKPTMISVLLTSQKTRRLLRTLCIVLTANGTPSDAHTPRHEDDNNLVGISPKCCVEEQDSKLSSLH